MKKKTLLLIQKSAIWKKFVGFNIVILFFFWFVALTDYSWYDNWVSLSFSVLVLCVSVITFFTLNFWGKLQGLLILLICMVSFPSALLSIPFHRYHSDQIPVQVETSPDGSRFIEVYCSFTSAHVTGFDHIEIIVRNKKFPFLQRDIGLYNNYSPRHCTGNMDSLVRWESNNTVYVIERQAYLDIGLINWDESIQNSGEIRGTH
ncbi:MAG TPA: hypothetical protein VK206_09425 [Anaerolineales bacterium]|nr:hypothetical protein [Anaerolineales bacterium]HLO29846.1 hypothetical protein [Anaerolineales bacterium]